MYFKYFKGVLEATNTVFGQLVMNGDYDLVETGDGGSPDLSI